MATNATAVAEPQSPPSTEEEDDDASGALAMSETRARATVAAPQDLRPGPPAAADPFGDYQDGARVPTSAQMVVPLQLLHNPDRRRSLLAFHGIGTGKTHVGVLTILEFLRVAEQRGRDGVGAPLPRRSDYAGLRGGDKKRAAAVYMEALAKYPYKVEVWAPFKSIIAGWKKALRAVSKQRPDALPPSVFDGEDPIVQFRTFAGLNTAYDRQGFWADGKTDIVRREEGTELLVFGLPDTVTAEQVGERVGVRAAGATVTKSSRGFFVEFKDRPAEAVRFHDLAQRTPLVVGGHAARVGWMRRSWFSGFVNRLIIVDEIHAGGFIATEPKKQRKKGGKAKAKAEAKGGEDDGAPGAARTRKKTKQSFADLNHRAPAPGGPGRHAGRSIAHMLVEATSYIRQADAAANALGVPGGAPVDRRPHVLALTATTDLRRPHAGAQHRGLPAARQRRDPAFVTAPAGGGGRRGPTTPRTASWTRRAASCRTCAARTLGRSRCASRRRRPGAARLRATRRSRGTTTTRSWRRPSPASRRRCSRGSTSAGNCGCRTRRRRS